MHIPQQAAFFRADLWRQRGESAIDLVQQANAERDSLSHRDTFVPSNLPAEEHQRLRDQLAALPQVKAAWIAGKQLTHLKEHPLYVIAVTPRGMFASADKLLQALAEKIETLEATYFVASAGDSAAIAKKVAKSGTKLI